MIEKFDAIVLGAGAAGLMCAICLGKRKDSGPGHNMVLTFIGASLLWVGWFGFNAGSNLEANGVTAVAFVNTMVATCAAAVSWRSRGSASHSTPITWPATANVIVHTGATPVFVDVRDGDLNIDPELVAAASDAGERHGARLAVDRCRGDRARA